MEAIDLGLSVKWATCNIGATLPEEYGNYYAWGEIIPKNIYNWETYKWGEGNKYNLTKYNTDSYYGRINNKIILDLKDDVARANWGGAWRMPTNEEWTELRENCTWTWTTKNGVNGYEVKGTNGNSIFLPAAGYRNDDGLYVAGGNGFYWSSSLDTDYPSRTWSVDFRSDDVSGNDVRSYYGQSVRPVLKSIDADNSNEGVSVPTGTENGYGYVDLGLPSGVKWATCNVGATKPEEYGDYYAWGETETKSTYDWNPYKWATATQEEWGGWNLETLTKYNTDSNYGTVDNKIVLDLEDDAASVNWGGAWRMPTDAEWRELHNNCTWRWTNGYNGTGVRGEIVTSKINGNSIFLPAAGFRYNDDLDFTGIYGYYWSSSLSTDHPNSAWDVYFRSVSVRRDDDNRCDGRSVRPVYNN